MSTPPANEPIGPSTPDPADPPTTRPSSTSNTMTVSGGTQIGNTFGLGDVDSHAHVRIGDIAIGAESTTAVGDLRAALSDARSLLIESAPTAAQRADITYEISKIMEALEVDEPAESPIRSRWAEIGRVLQPVVDASTKVAEVVGKITDLVAAVFQPG